MAGSQVTTLGLECKGIFSTESPLGVPSGEMSGQLPCRSAEVKIFSVFLCQRCREIWREILVKCSVLRFQGLGVRGSGTH